MPTHREIASAMIVALRKRPCRHPKARGVRVSVFIEGERQSRHRKIASKVLGRRLLRGEQVHHRDGNQYNNDPRNLAVMPSGSAHARLHSEQRRVGYRIHVASVEEVALIEAVPLCLWHGVHCRLVCYGPQVARCEALRAAANDERKGEDEKADHENAAARR